jgi:hypothetical protein
MARQPLFRGSFEAPPLSHGTSPPPGQPSSVGARQIIAITEAFAMREGKETRNYADRCGAMSGPLCIDGHLAANKLLSRHVASLSVQRELLLFYWA